MYDYDSAKADPDFLQKETWRAKADRYVPIAGPGGGSEGLPPGKVGKSNGLESIPLDSGKCI